MGKKKKKTSKEEKLLQKEADWIAKDPKVMRLLRVARRQFEKGETWTMEWRGEYLYFIPSPVLRRKGKKTKRIKS